MKSCNFCGYEKPWKEFPFITSQKPELTRRYNGLCRSCQDEEKAFAKRQSQELQAFNRFLHQSP